MATSATWMDRLMGKSGVEARAYAHATSPGKNGNTGDYQLRPFPNESIHLFTKRIDNSRVIRQEDPQAPRACWQLIGGVGASAVLLIGMLLPSGSRIIAGYQIDALKKQEKLLLVQKEELELEKSKLLSPERLAELASRQKFIDPDPSRIVHLGRTLPPAPNTLVAMRRTPAPPLARQTPAPATAAARSEAAAAALAAEPAVQPAAKQPEQENP